MSSSRRLYGVSYKDVKDEVKDAILNLTIEHYYEGPDCDYNETRDCLFWKFGVNIFSNVEIYLKLEIDKAEGNLVCWSFHFPEYKINYPFKKKGDKNV